jgi:Carboxypeptidase regulatory-like domain
MRIFKRQMAIVESFLFGALLFLFLCVSSHWYPVAAQTLTTGQVLGQVTDPVGAAVAQAKIDLRNNATGAERTTTSDQDGHYTFAQVAPGIYSVMVTASGFAKSLLPSVAVEVGKTSTINMTLKVGTISEVVEVHSTPGAELQMLDATVGNTIRDEVLHALPTLDRNTTSLLLLQPLAMPQQFGSQSSRFGGQVAGARSDQNSFLLDGGEITNPTSGNSDYWKAFNGAPEGSIPTPVESIQEFSVETNNPSGSQSLSLGGGAQVVMVTKSGTNTFHGSAYEGYRGSALNANRWDANRLGRPRPNVVDNRFGGSLGGHFLPDKWKTYFYGHYEGRRRHEATFVTRLVPTVSLLQGILRFRDNAGNIINYSLQPGNVANLCGSSGSGSCDPRNLGMNPAIRQLWQLEPAGNDTSQGDGLNTIGFSAFGKLPNTSDLGVIRLDHSFGSRFHWTTSYRYYKEDAGILRQADIGGILTGGTKGVPNIISSIPRQPRYFVSGLTANITPKLTNDLHISYLRDWWQWISLPPFPQLPGTTPAALVPGGDTVNALVPVNIDTQGSRNRLWNSHGWAFKDDVSWVRGTHLLRFGGSFNHTWAYFQRDDGQLNSQKTLQYFMGNTIGGLSFPASSRPRACSATVTTNCLPANQNSTWNNLYAQVLGLVDAASVLRARDAQLQLLPEGTDLKNAVKYNQTTLYLQDTWRIRPTLALTYGLAWAATIPPVEDSGKLMITVTPSGDIVLPRNYLEQRKQAALAGKVFNPPVGFSPIGKTGRKYPFDFVGRNFEPRIAVAWQPNFGSGVLRTLFGRNKSVLRGGYWHFYDRLNGVQTAIDTLQALGFAQSLLCLGPSRTAGAAADCRGNSGTDPSTAFRVGIDGSTITLPTLFSSITPPVVAGVGTPPPFPFVPSSQVQDPQWKPGSHNQWDFTIQRELPGRSRIEIGYVGHTARNIYQGIDLNQVPFFMTAGGQTFAQAFDTVARQIALGAVTPQPFFETILAGSSFCQGQLSCTAGVVSRFSGDITNQRVRNVFNGIQSAFTTGPATNAATQFTNFFYWSSLAKSNYHAGFISYRIRASHGLTLDANLTYGHSLDNVGVNQDTDQAFTNSYNPDYDYGTSLFDRKFVLTILGVYDLPFHSRTGWLNRIVGGWQVAPIVSVASGLPLRVLDGSGQEFGQSGFGAVSEAIRIGTGGSTAGRFHAAPASGCGSSASGSGSGLNIFADPQAVCNQFRPIQLSVDKTSRGGTLRGFKAWNVDMSLTKKIAITERTSLTLSSSFFNLFNHVNFLDPAVSLQSPQTFGVVTTQGNDPRQISLGLRLDF